jgi:hypothetical protein
MGTRGRRSLGEPKKKGARGERGGCGYTRAGIESSVKKRTR